MPIVLATPEFRQAQEDAVFGVVGSAAQLLVDYQISVFQSAGLTAAGELEPIRPPATALTSFQALWAWLRDEVIAERLADVWQVSEANAANILNVEFASPRSLVDALSGQDSLIGLPELIAARAQQVVRQGVVDGVDPSRIAARLRADVSELAANRARLIARTEANAIVNESNQRVVAASGEQLWKRWDAAEDARTRATHAEADGQTVPLDGFFRVGAFTGQRPGDPSLGVERISCRCALLYLDASEI